MADSADDLLARARNALARWANAKPATSAEWMSATDLVDAVTDLDELLSAGGPLPAEWADRAPSRPSEDVLLPGQRPSPCQDHGDWDCTACPPAPPKVIRRPWLRS